MRLSRRIAACILMLAAGLALPAAGADRLAIVLSESGEAYAEVAAALRRDLQGAFEVEQRGLNGFDEVRAQRWRALVAVGTEACRTTASENVAPLTLCVLLPKAPFERIAGGKRNGSAALAAIVLDQPPARQLELIRLALPEQRRVGVLLGPDSASLERPLQQAAAPDLRLRFGRLGSPEDVPSLLQDMLGSSDVLLALPDSAVVNTRTISLVLRLGLRRTVPLIAFSPAYVRAGALAAVYSTPKQIARQAARTLRAHLAGRETPAQQYPAEFEVAVNRHVARSLGIELEDEARLAARLRALEAAR